MANQRILYTEEMVGDNHPTKADTLNRHAMVEHLEDGTHENGFIGCDGTAGRVLRVGKLKIDDGTNASTLKCTWVATWNISAIAVTDNIAKGATTGDFSLDAAGETLSIETSGLDGNCVAVLSGDVNTNSSGSQLDAQSFESSSKISCRVSVGGTGTDLDQTVLVDTGLYYITIAFLTDA